MPLLKNRHVLIAALVAPVLALMSYFAIDAFVGERPQPALPGQSYLREEKPNCRYDSGSCGLKNADFELVLRVEESDPGRFLLMLDAEFPLEGVKVAMAEGEAKAGRPADMRQVNLDGLSWSLEIARPEPDHHRLHLVASSGGVLYFGDAAMKFAAKTIGEP